MGLLKKKYKHEIHTKVVGVTFDDPVSGMNRQAIIRSFVKPGVELKLVPEPDNPVDNQAVAVCLKRRVLLVASKDYQIGYLHGDLAHEMFRKMTRYDVEPVVTVLNVTGGDKKKPTPCSNRLRLPPWDSRTARERL